MVVAASILGLTVGLSLARPKLWRFEIHHSHAAIIGATLAVLAQLVPLAQVWFALKNVLFFPIVTIVSLMATTLIAERAGLFHIIAKQIARRAQGNPRRLFAYIFFTGTVTGTIFTNDAAVLIFTPLVFNLIEEVKTENWTLTNKFPFYFAVLYVANLVGALVISNPINMIVATIFRIRFLDYAIWMMLPALVSMVVTFVVLRFFFRKSIPAEYRITEEINSPDKYSWFAKTCGVVLLVSLVGFFSENLTGIPTWTVALSGALFLMILYTITSGSGTGQIVKGIGWDVIVFVVGIFIVSMGLRNAGLTEVVARFIEREAGTHIPKLIYVTGFVATISSAIMDNHPTADMMSWVIREFPLADLGQKILAFSSLIGGNLGPKMSPLGSLAALLWLRMLKDRGVNIPYKLYILTGIPVTLIAVLASLTVLNIEYLFFVMLHGK